MPPSCLHPPPPLCPGCTERCHSWLYLPKCKSLLLHDLYPVIIMAHGFGQQKVGSGGTALLSTIQRRQPPLARLHLTPLGPHQSQDFGLQRYAELFAMQGAAVLAFDYRAFGLSEGQPRNYVSPNRHVEDWVAAIDHIADMGSTRKVRM